MYHNMLIFFNFQDRESKTLFAGAASRMFYTLPGTVAKTGFQQARSNTGLNVFKDDLTVWILPNHPYI